jgi:hypothetical protein
MFFYLVLAYLFIHLFFFQIVELYTHDWVTYAEEILQIIIVWENFWQTFKALLKELALYLYTNCRSRSNRAIFRTFTCWSKRWERCWKSLANILHEFFELIPDEQTATRMKSGWRRCFSRLLNVSSSEGPAWDWKHHVRAMDTTL